jgi:hypothetical protein
MTARWTPVLLIWLTVATALFELFSRLQLILTDAQNSLSGLLIFLFFVSLITGGLQFGRYGQTIQNLVQSWDDEMKRDILAFLRARKIRLMTTLFFLIVVMIARFLFPYFLSKKLVSEVLLYLFLIGLFHTALISSLILFKMSRTIQWIKRENELALLEKA